MNAALLVRALLHPPPPHLALSTPWMLAGRRVSLFLTVPSLALEYYREPAVRRLDKLCTSIHGGKGDQGCRGDSLQKGS